MLRNTPHRAVISARMITALMVLVFIVGLFVGEAVRTGASTQALDNAVRVARSNAQMEGVPNYQNYAAPAALPNSNGAAEPSIGVNWKTDKVFFQAGISTYRVSFDDSQTPAVATWEDRSANLERNCTAEETLDPILYTDSREGRTIESQLILAPAPANSLSCFTTDDGETWTPSQGGGLNSGIDHQTIGGGPYSPNLVPAPVTSYPNAFYYCSQSIAEATCSRSDDGGLTFPVGVPIYTITECGGLHGHVKVSPAADPLQPMTTGKFVGTVYVPNFDCNTAQGVSVSEDSGLTWEVRRVPGSTIAGESDPSVGIGANGTVYFGYQNGDGHPRIAVSRDQGRTWTNDQDVGTALGIQNIQFPAVVAGDDDRAAFTFIGTTTGGNDQAAGFPGVWHMYAAHTFDGGVTWTTVDVTPIDPLQKGCVWLAGGSNPCRNMLDFNDATVDEEGRVLIGYADGCIDTCLALDPNGPTRKYDDYGTIARQTTGKRLFARFDPVIPNATVTATTVGSTATGTILPTITTTTLASTATGTALATTTTGSTVVPTTGSTLVPTSTTTPTIPPGGIRTPTPPVNNPTASTTGVSTANPTTSATAASTTNPTASTTGVSTANPTASTGTGPRLYLPFVAR